MTCSFLHKAIETIKKKNSSSSFSCRRKHLMLNLVACGPQEDNIFYWNLCPSLVFLGWQRTYPLRTITSSTQTTAQEYIGYCSIVAFFSFKYFHLAFRHAPPINLVSQPKKQKKMTAWWIPPLSVLNISSGTPWRKALFSFFRNFASIT